MRRGHCSVARQRTARQQHSICAPVNGRARVYVSVYGGPPRVLYVVRIARTNHRCIHIGRAIHITIFGLGKLSDIQPTNDSTNYGANKKRLPHNIRLAYTSIRTHITLLVPCAYYETVEHLMLNVLLFIILKLYIFNNPRLLSVVRGLQGLTVQQKHHNFN